MKGMAISVVVSLVIVMLTLAVAIFFLFSNYEYLSKELFGMFDRLSAF